MQSTGDSLRNLLFVGLARLKADTMPDRIAKLDELEPGLKAMAERLLDMAKRWSQYTPETVPKELVGEALDLYEDLIKLLRVLWDVPERGVSNGADVKNEPGEPVH